jgi:teichuronic acid biosynthesis glycosyltransferase TuaG
LKQPLITAIIPTYNSEKYIKGAIESILNQTYKNIEIIVFDDCSTDSTKQICELYKGYSNFSFIIDNQHTGNIAKARNCSIDLAKGEYIAFLDSDDLWEQNKIEEQLKYTDRYNFICSNAKIIDNKNNIISDEYFTDMHNINEISICDLIIDNFVITSTVLSKKEVIIKAGYFSNELGNLAEDYALWLNAAKISEIKYLNDSLIRYRRHTTNISYRDDVFRINMLLETIKLRNQFTHTEDRNLNRMAIKGIINIKSELAETYLKNNRYDEYFKNMKYIFINYSPKTSTEYFKLYFKFFYLLLKKLIKGSNKSKR